PPVTLTMGVVVPETITMSSVDGQVLRTASCVSAPPTTTCACGEMPSSPARAGSTFPRMPPEEYKGGRSSGESWKDSQSSSDQLPASTSYKSVSDACECS